MMNYVLDMKKLTQNELAEMTGKDHAQVSKWVTGKISNPSRETMRLIGEVLNIDIYRLEDGYMFSHGTPQETHIKETATTYSARDREMRTYLQRRMVRLSQEMQELATLLDMINHNQESNEGPHDN